MSFKLVSEKENRRLRGFSLHAKVSREEAIGTFCNLENGVEEAVGCKAFEVHLRGLYIGINFKPELTGSFSGKNVENFSSGLISASLLNGRIPQALNPDMTFFIDIALTHASAKREEKS